MEPISQPIPQDEAEEIMRNDIVALLSADVHCPLARSIETVLAVMTRSTDCLSESLRYWQEKE